MDNEHYEGHVVPESPGSSSVSGNVKIVNPIPRRDVDQLNLNPDARPFRSVKQEFRYLTYSALKIPGFNPHAPPFPGNSHAYGARGYPVVDPDEAWYVYEPNASRTVANHPEAIGHSAYGRSVPALDSRSHDNGRLVDEGFYSRNHAELVSPHSHATWPMSPEILDVRPRRAPASELELAVQHRLANMNILDEENNSMRHEEDRRNGGALEHFMRSISDNVAEIRKSQQDFYTEFMTLERKVDQAFTRIEEIESHRNCTSRNSLLDPCPDRDRNRDYRQKFYDEEPKISWEEVYDGGRYVNRGETLDFGTRGATALPNNSTLNNQVPPGSRANNYLDNFRSNSHQNMLSAPKNMPGGMRFRDSSSTPGSWCQQLDNSRRYSDDSRGGKISASTPRNRYRGGDFVENIGTKLRNQEQLPNRSSVRRNNSSSIRSRSPLGNESVDASSNSSTSTLPLVREADICMQSIVDLIGTFLRQNASRPGYISNVLRKLNEINSPLDRAQVLDRLFSIVPAPVSQKAETVSLGESSWVNTVTELANYLERYGKVTERCLGEDGGGIGEAAAFANNSAERRQRRPSGECFTENQTLVNNLAHPETENLQVKSPRLFNHGPEPEAHRPLEYLEPRGEFSFELFTDEESENLRKYDSGSRQRKDYTGSPELLFESEMEESRGLRLDTNQVYSPGLETARESDVGSRSERNGEDPGAGEDESDAGATGGHESG